MYGLEFLALWALIFLALTFWEWLSTNFMGIGQRVPRMDKNYEHGNVNGNEWRGYVTTKYSKNVNYESGYFVFTLLEEVDRIGNTEGKRFVYTMHLHSQVVYSSIEKAQKDIESVFAVNAPSWQQFIILPATLKQL